MGKYNYKNILQSIHISVISCIQLLQYKCATQVKLPATFTAGLNRFFFVIIVAITLSSCGKNTPATPPIFEVLDKSRTGLDFNNTLHPDSVFNVLDYMYFYNGAGVAAGDFNNDGLIDLFFAANQSTNKIFLNTGNLHFKDVTATAKLPQDGGWSAGVSVVDINNDGLLDFYISRVGNYEVLKANNQLLICKGIDKNGVPFYSDETAGWGLVFSGFSTQAAFLDYDMDGDLDMFLLNHSVHQNGTFAERSLFMGTYHPLAGERLFKNEGNHFTDITKACGINSSAIGYGLGVCVADINLDGWPDMYIGNDFHENDYLYINQHNGTFKEVSGEEMMHTSQFSMGVDIADINNDAYPEIISMDMLPEDPSILKRSLGEDNYDLFYEKIGYGYSFQYTRNNLQFNQGNNHFSELGLYAGVAATDWSWAPLWLDFDNDGLKDLFVSNGIPKRMNDIDYANYVSNDVVQQNMANQTKGQKDMALIEKFPQIKLPNKFFSNKGNLQFIDRQDAIADNAPSYSNGAVYADFDNDGDLDIVVNNIDADAVLYENKTAESSAQHFLQLHLKGPAANINAVGAKLLLYTGNSIRTYEKYPVHGFLSSMEIPLHIGLNNTKPDSMVLVWPDNTCQHLTAADTGIVHLSYQKGLPNFNYTALQQHQPNTTIHMADITAATGLKYTHQENPFNEFNREQLIPRMFSTEGPALAVGDINKDGLEDVFIGAAKRVKNALFIQNANGTFTQSQQPALAADSVYEDVSACFTDVNNDGQIDLVIASGGNEFFGHDEHNTPRVYLNDGKAHFTKLAGAFDTLYTTASCIIPCDFNKDGFTDLFIGGRCVPNAYGQIPASYLLQNNGAGKFTNVTSKYAKDLSTIGFVTNAYWCDIDKDGDSDLLLSLEWGPITAFINNKGSFTKLPLTTQNGWWNNLLPCDIDNDGDIDLIAGNLGLNSRLKASEEEPVRMYYNDFDGNGKKEQVLTYYLQHREYPFASIGELQKQMPVLKKQFLYAADFAKATLPEIFTADKLNNATLFTASYFASALLINDGKLHFTPKALPWQAQLSPVKDAVIINANNDALPDILLTGNFYENNIEMGRYDASYGTILINKGSGNFESSSINGLSIQGQVRHILPLQLGKNAAYILARNNQPVQIIQQLQSKK